MARGDEVLPVWRVLPAPLLVRPDRHLHLDPHGDAHQDLRIPRRLEMLDSRAQTSDLQGLALRGANTKRSVSYPSGKLPTLAIPRSSLLKQSSSSSTRRRLEKASETLRAGFAVQHAEWGRSQKAKDGGT